VPAAAFSFRTGCAARHSSNAWLIGRTIDGVQLRRGLLAFAIVLLAVSFGAALSAPDEEGEPATTTTPQTARSNTPTAVRTTLRQPAPERPPVRRLDVNAHVVLTVSARVAGNVEVPGLGLLQPVSPGAPAVFDLLASRPGRYEVAHTTLSGERTVLGSLLVEDS
jgi:hypothetical protein